MEFLLETYKTLEAALLAAETEDEMIAVGIQLQIVGREIFNAS